MIFTFFIALLVVVIVFGLIFASIFSVAMICEILSGFRKNKEGDDIHNLYNR